MDIKRFELPDGPWADIHHRFTHGQAKAITSGWMAAMTDNDPLEAQTVVVRQMVDKWLVYDESKVGIPFPESIDAAPQDVIQLLFEECEPLVASLIGGGSAPNRAARRAGSKKV